MPKKSSEIVQQSSVEAVMGQRRSSRLADKHNLVSPQPRPSKIGSEGLHKFEDTHSAHLSSGVSSAGHTAVTWSGEASSALDKASVALKSGLLLPKSGAVCSSALNSEPANVVDISGLWGLLPEEVRGLR